VKLFEVVEREYVCRVAAVQGAAGESGVHRRMASGGAGKRGAG